MNRYEGIFTFDTENHRYIPIEQAGVIDRMSYTPAEPLIKDEKIRKAVKEWAEANGFNVARYSSVNDCFCYQGDMLFIEPSYELEQLERLGYRTIPELCGEEEE